MLLIPALAGCLGGRDGARRPNIVLILTDDQGCGDVAFTGNDVLKTPNMDRMALESVHFTHFYVSPVCAPTRASLMTGRYHQRTGVFGVIEGREFMVEQEKTVAEYLSDAGYATGLFGKWHLGENYPWTPLAQGFDEFVGFRDGSNPYFDVEIEDNGRPYQTQGYLTDVLTDRAIDFMERRQEEPFFLYLAYNAPHSPLEAPDSYLEPYRHLPQHTALVYGMMASVDENVGRLLRRLDELGLTDDTLVLFLSDNGPLYGGGGYEQTERFNCGLKGTKYSVDEGGMRVPLAVRWPKAGSGGRKVDVPSAHIDLLPTIMDYAGLSIPGSNHIDGRSLRPLIDGASESWPDRLLFMNYPGEAGQRDREPSPYPGGMATDGRYKMVDGVALYDLENDPGETRDIAGDQPEKLAGLDEAYRRFWSEVTSQRAPYPRVHIGHPEENPAVLTTHWALLEGGLAFQFSDDPPRYRSIGVHGDRIARWNPEGSATWRLDVRTAGRYQISAHLRCAETEAGANMRARFGSAFAENPIAGCTGEDAEWQTIVLGEVDLDVGEVDLSLSIDRGGKGLRVRDVLIESIVIPVLRK